MHIFNIRRAACAAKEGREIARPDKEAKSQNKKSEYLYRDAQTHIILYNTGRRAIRVEASGVYV